jgi:hypothetical protein
VTLQENRYIKFYVVKMSHPSPPPRGGGTSHTLDSYPTFTGSGGHSRDQGGRRTKCSMDGMIHLDDLLPFRCHSQEGDLTSNSLLFHDSTTPGSILLNTNY